MGSRQTDILLLYYMEKSLGNTWTFLELMWTLWGKALLQSLSTWRRTKLSPPTTRSTSPKATHLNSEGNSLLIFLFFVEGVVDSLESSPAGLLPINSSSTLAAKSSSTTSPSSNPFFMLLLTIAPFSSPFSSLAFSLEGSLPPEELFALWTVSEVPFDITSSGEIS